MRIPMTKIDLDSDDIFVQSSPSVKKTHRERPYRSELDQRIEHKQTRSVYRKSAKQKRQYEDA